MDVGLARMIVEETFDLAAEAACPDAIRWAAWKQAHGLITRGVRASLVMLQKAALVGDRTLEEQYTAQADREHERIYGEPDRK
jgi:hypothetical protein